LVAPAASPVRWFLLRSPKTKDLRSSRRSPPFNKKSRRFSSSPKRLTELLNTKSCVIVFCWYCIHRRNRWRNKFCIFCEKNNGRVYLAYQKIRNVKILPFLRKGFLEQREFSLGTHVNLFNC
jgi:hypothetical protein